MYSLNQISRLKQLVQIGILAGFMATMFLASTARAQPLNQENNDYKYEQVYAETKYDYDPHRHLDVVCREGWRAISCEAAIHGKNDHGFSMYFIALNEAHPEGFKKVGDGHNVKYEHTANHPEYYGCHFRANNFLDYFSLSDTYKDFYEGFEWTLKGYATCVPEDYVDYYKTDSYYPEYGYPQDW